MTTTQFIAALSVAIVSAEASRNHPDVRVPDLIRGLGVASLWKVAHTAAAKVIGDDDRPCVQVQEAAWSAAIDAMHALQQRAQGAHLN